MSAIKREVKPTLATPVRPRRRRMLVPLAVIGAALLAVVLVAAVVLVPDQEPPATATDRPPVNVATMTVEPVAQFEDTFTMPAVVEPWATTLIAAEVSGRVLRIEAREGEPIRPSQPLVYIDPELMEAEFERASAQAEHDRRDVERLMELSQRGAATATEVDLARTALRRSEADLQTARQRLDRTVIRAPARGRDAEATAEVVGLLDDLRVEIGEFVSPGVPVAEIVDVGAVKIEVDIPERDVNFLRVGQPAQVRAEGLGGRSFSGTVTFIRMAADPRTRTFRTQIRVPNPDGALRPGMIVRVSMVRQVLQDVLLIPLDTVIPLEAGYEVYVVEDGQARQRLVRLGVLRGRHAQVLPVGPGDPGYDPNVPSLAVGDQLIVRGQRLVGDRQEVAVLPDTVEMPEPRSGRQDGPAAEPPSVEVPELPLDLPIGADAP